MCKLFSSICNPRNLSDSEEFLQSAPCPQLILTGLIRTLYSWFNLWMSPFWVKIKFTRFALVYISLPPYVLYWSYFTYFAYFVYRTHFSVFRCLFPLLLGPHPRAQLFTYHHIHPSTLFWLLSQEAPGKSADSLCMYKGIVPFSPNRDCFRCGKRKCFTQR